MNRKGPKPKELSEIRCGSMIFLLRLAEIPFKMKKVPTIYTVYMITVIICSCSTLIGMVVDVYIHRDDLKLAMTRELALFPFTNFMWIFSTCQ
jgi:hypothetical protein